MIARSAVAILILGLFGAAPALGQEGSGAAEDTAPGSSSLQLPDVPFGLGERLRYRVKFGPVEVGEAVMHLAGIDTVDGHPTYHLDFHIQGGVLFYKLDDRQQSWMDVYRLASRRFRQDLQEGDYERHLEYEIDQERGVYEASNGETDSIPPNALDEAAFVYFVRTIPLEVGDSYEWNRHFRSEKNPVILRVLRTEGVEVPAGEFETIVVRPIIKAGGLYSEGGEAEIYLTDDEHRIPVLMKSKLKVGALSLELVEYETGTPITPAMLDE